MNLKRVVRDGTVVALLCAIFYFSASAIDKIRKPEDRAYSLDRRLAEQYFASRKWAAAAVHFAKLTEEDRFNGYAWFHQAICHLSMRNEVVEDFKVLRESGAAQPELDQLILKQTEFEDQAIRCLQESSKFLRHRRRSLVNMAVVYVGREEWGNALKLLTTYIDEGNMLIRTLENIGGLGIGGRSMIGQDPEDHPDAKLHRFAEFWKLVDREDEIRGSNVESIPPPARPF